MSFRVWIELEAPMARRKQLHVRLDERDLEELEAFAEREGVSVAFVVRRLVRSLVRPPVNAQIRSTRTRPEIVTRVVE